MQASKRLDSLRSSSSTLVHLCFCDLYPAAPTEENGFRQKSEKKTAICAWTGTASIEENNFGLSCCLWLKIRKPKVELPYISVQSKTAPETANTKHNKCCHQMAPGKQDRKNRILSQGSKKQYKK